MPCCISQAEIGEGNLDWPEILSACHEAGTEWLVVEQDECARDPLESLAMSFQNLARCFARIRFRSLGLHRP